MTKLTTEEVNERLAIQVSIGEKIGDDTLIKCSNLTGWLMGDSIIGVLKPLVTNKERREHLLKMDYFSNKY